MAKTITVTDEVYKMLLERTANHQKTANHRISINDVIEKLLRGTEK